MTNALISSAVVPTERPARYGKQLASHLGRRSGSTWDDDAGRGRIFFDGGAAWVDVACEGSELRFDLTAGPDLVERLENVIGAHLVRFGGEKDALVVTWTRADGSPGTRQDATTSHEHGRP